MSKTECQTIDAGTFYDGAVGAIYKEGMLVDTGLPPGLLYKSLYTKGGWLKRLLPRYKR